MKTTFVSMIEAALTLVRKAQAEIDCDKSDLAKDTLNCAASRLLNVIGNCGAQPQHGRKTTAHGWTILQQSCRDKRGATVVLCDLDREFCTWIMDKDGNCFWGDYNQDIVSAAERYAKRVHDQFHGKGVV